MNCIEAMNCLDMNIAREQFNFYVLALVVPMVTMFIGVGIWQLRTKIKANKVLRALR